MPITYPVLELKPDGGVEQVTVKQTGGNTPTLKDFQTYVKKRTLPAPIVSYPYGTKRLSFFGYTKGKEGEVSQHQLPPPCEAPEIYGSIILVVHPVKTAWDADSSALEVFTAADYEAFYEKACSGDLEEEAEDGVDEDDVDVGEEEEVEDTEETEEGQEGDEEGAEGVDEEGNLEEEEEETPRPRVSRRIVKIDPQQLQFQFKSVLEEQDTTDPEAVETNTNRKATFETCQNLLSEHCDDDDIGDLERGIFNASIEEAKRRMIPQTWEHTTFVWIYKMISKRAIGNFNPESYIGNQHLIERWKEGEFTLDQIGRWSPYELKPSNWKHLKDQQFRREKRILEGNLSMATDRFRCSGCHKKMCSYYELQTRSADEPMTIFISCLNCGKNWKQ
jgi:hypothetical protein